ncbi:SLC13 family permease [Salidesulfovibrio onnuriiensis]|uniref:SLC13 family permease n=1 Tax=Salidesulfovibrio onnuriiensis TaxID=2583823 RepID=UPI0011CCBB44|nr:SLC13 family permease [Salidesulfovibrio onnuriiensis]
MNTPIDKNPALKCDSFDPLDMRNYSLEKLPTLPAGPIMEMIKRFGVPLAVLFFCIFHFQLVEVGSFASQTKVPAEHCYTMLGIFGASLILWISEAIPNYLTSLLLIIAVVLTGILNEKTAYAYFGHPVMILNVASFILASMLVATGLAKRIALKFIMRAGHHATPIFWTFLILNLVLGAFINATAAKAALLLPIFMVISAIYGATGGDCRNNFGRNLVLQNLLGINVSCSAYVTGSAANLVAASMLAGAGAQIFYMDWFMALAPLAFIVLALGWILGVKLIFPIKGRENEPSIEGGLDRLRKELEKMGPITLNEIKAATIFLLVLGFWATDKLHGMSATAIALAGAALCLMPSFSKLPKIGVINWNNTDIPWHLLLFSFGAYVLGGGIKKTNIVGIGINNLFDAIGLNGDPNKLLIFLVIAVLFNYSSILNQSKTARTIIFFPIIIGIAENFGWNVLGFGLPMAFLINQVYVLYFNSKPATICYLANHYSSFESFKYGIVMQTVVLLCLIPWVQYVMPLMGFDSKLW